MACKFTFQLIGIVKTDLAHFVDVSNLEEVSLAIKCNLRAFFGTFETRRIWKQVSILVPSMAVVVNAPLGLARLSLIVK